MRKRIAFCTGATGQDFSHLAELLLEKEYKVYGMVRRVSTPRFDNIRHIINDIEIVQGDLTDQNSLDYLVRKIEPDEIYNLGAMSQVHVSFSQPELTMNVDGLGPLRLMESMRKFHPTAKFYQASTSEMFSGDPSQAPQDENTPLSPRSPYGIAKLFAHHCVRIYRESYGLFTCAGILFNHEGPRRGIEFVTRKITNYVGNISHWHDDETPKLKLGNLASSRDWGYAGDYVRGMWLMLQQEKPDDFVLATGETHTIREFLREAFSYIEEDMWKFIEIDETLLRPNEVHVLCGNPAKAKRVLGWQPTVGFEELVKIMVEADIEAAR